MKENFRPRPDDPGWLREPRQRRGAVERLLETAERIDHSQVLGLAAGNDAPVGELEHLAAVELAPHRDGGDELPCTSSSSACSTRRSRATSERAKLRYPCTGPPDDDDSRMPSPPSSAFAADEMKNEPPKIWLDFKK